MRELRVFVALFLFTAAVEARPVKPEMVRPAKVQATAAKTVSVDCTKGQSIQAAIDKNAGPVTIDIEGICSENVVIESKTVTLRGDDPNADGILGVAANVATLAIVHSTFTSLENLSFSGLGTGVNAVRSSVVLTNCRTTNNTFNGVLLGFASSGNATGLVSANNLRGVLVSNASSFFCLGCTFTNNSRAAQSQRASVLSLLDSVVTGLHGVSAFNDSYADIDCASEVSTYPCSLNVTGFAAQSTGGGQAGMFGAGDFTGRLFADDHSQAFVLGSRQLPSTTGTNVVDTFGMLWVAPLEDENAVMQQSTVSRPTNVSGFGRMLVRDASTISGNVQCSSAGDAWLDSTVITPMGVTVTGCDHASVP